ncbi:methylglyoxal synthase [Labilibaculum manganireducens]|uniref:Methylglyoxal synthase n=1 Tax=Labilibaculum manganireducens TaxID=1940525 RepID=A0A2N3HVY6_9BACT|nr:methylglyoxal synthase [Labilibaculum manganireducens]PKQ62198.1 methylglyoxal synthase [Labilibaculum manganireducens]
MKKKKTIALVAHDNRKKDLMDWVAYNWKELVLHDLVCTGTTGSLVGEVLEKKCEENNVVPPIITRLKSGPLGGDQQLGSLIAEQKVNILIFFWDPMQPQPHDVDVKALLRICALYNIVTATNRSTADFVVSSLLFHQDYKPMLKDYTAYIKRQIDPSS